MYTFNFLHQIYFQVGNKSLKLNLVKLQVITLMDCQTYISLVVKAEPSKNPTTSCSTSGQTFSMILRNLQKQTYNIFTFLRQSSFGLQHTHIELNSFLPRYNEQYHRMQVDDSVTHCTLAELEATVKEGQNYPDFTDQ